MIQTGCLKLHVPLSSPLHQKKKKKKNMFPEDIFGSKEWKLTLQVEMPCLSKLWQKDQIKDVQYKMTVTVQVYGKVMLKTIFFFFKGKRKRLGGIHRNLKQGKKKRWREIREVILFLYTALTLTYLYVRNPFSTLLTKGRGELFQGSLRRCASSPEQVVSH